MKQRVLGLVSALVLTLSITASAAPASTTAAQAAPDRLDRLLGLARIWAEVKFFHPAMFQRPIDWDGALTTAIPEVEAASDAASYRAAIGHLLAAVGDPRTAVETASADDAAPAAWRSWAADGVLVLNARLPGRGDDYAATRRLAREVRPEIAKARVVVVDLRGCADGDDRLIESILGSLPATQRWPTIRSVQHDGFRSQGDTNRLTYTTSWIVTAAGAPTPGATPGPKHVVFVVDPAHMLPMQAVALWASGHATLVSPGPLDEASAAVVKGIALPYGLIGRLRIADVTLPEGRGLSADLVVPRGEDIRARAIAIASAIAAGAPGPHGPEHRGSAASDLRLVDDDPAPLTGLPSRERRMLAAIKAWAVIDYFHGTRRLDHDWDRQLRLTLQRLDTTTDAVAYQSALAEMLVALGGGHTYVRRHDEVSNRASTVAFWRRIEGKIVVGGLRDEAVARDAGIAPGDELVSIDGVPAEQAAADKLRIMASGNDEARRQRAVTFIDRGAFGSKVDIEWRHPGDTPRRMTMTRSYDYDHNFWARSGPHYRVLPDDIGYADLARLTSDEVDAMFDALGKTRAIVFDMRGYPNGTAWLIGERINARAAPWLAEIRTPQVTAFTARTDITVRELQQSQTSEKPLYRGKVVVLIDDRAVSAAEHLCLVFEATSGATFIGSPTDGTNGEETYVKLPGNLEMRFTGMEIFHSDGRQLQQIGIQPQITVRPTLRGLRAGKDEVLDRALRYLQTRK